MGYNTTVVVMNDALHAIAEDQEFGKRLAHAIMEAFGGKRVDVPAYGKSVIHCNAATVIETHHADHMVTVRVGMNSGEVVPHIPKSENQIPKRKTGRNPVNATR